MNKETSGPAFPLADSCCEYGNTSRSDANGMTMRDYFAAQAMQGLLAAWTHGVPEPEAIAQASYRYADDMLKARAE